MQVAVDDMKTLDLDGTSYVENPIKLNTDVKDTVKHTKKVDPQEAQKLYLDYLTKTTKDVDSVTYIDDNDLYIKIYDTVDGDTSFQKHGRVTETLDYIMNQKDTSRLLDVVKSSR